MKVSVSSGVIETPEKVEPEADGSPPSKINIRSSPTTELKDMLKGVKRLHAFCHQLEIMPIEAIRLDIKDKYEICELFAEFDNDLSDWILKMEKNSTEIGQYTSFARDFIHYQFQVQKDISFAVLIFLNYISKFKLPLAAAFVEVFQLSLENTVCDVCINLKMGQEAKEEIPRINLGYLRKLVAVESDCCDDDMNDPDFYQDKQYSHTGDIISDTSSDTGDSKEDIKMTKTGIVDKLLYGHETNPFAISDDDDVYKFQEDCLCVNPFASSEDDLKTTQDKISHFVPKKTSSIKSNLASVMFACDHCKRSFSTSYNLKLHGIQVHRIFPDNMDRFECPECDFVTGSRIGYTRHASTHLKKTPKKV